jgi:hypothetical protein
MGRFLAKDSFAGNYAMPLSMNGWNYTHSNPINLTDPTGHFINPTGPQTCGSYIFSNGFLPIPNITAQGLVELCKGFYNQSFWRSFSLPGGVGNYDCDSLNRTIWGKPTTAAALFGDYICERGPDHVYFNGGDILTHKLSRSIALDKIRREFYQHGTIYPREEEFGDPFTYFNEWRDLQVDLEFPLVPVMGSFDVSVTSAAGNRVKFWVHNRTDLASGTHFIGSFPPDGQGDNPLTVEEVIKDNPNSDEPKPKRESRTRYDSPKARETGEARGFPNGDFPSCIL